MAQYGGAVFVSLKSDQVNLTFTRCIFENNQALFQRLPSGQTGDFIDCSEILVLSHGIEMFSCKFIQNRGSQGAVKIIVMKSDTKSVHLTENEYYEWKAISFIDCEFYQDKKSQSSISIVDKSKQRAGNPIEFSGCRFRGKLQNWAHYIDGFLQSKKKAKMPSCTFEDENEGSPVNIDLINEDENRQIDIEINTNFSKIWTRLHMIVLVIAFFVLMCIKASLKIYYSVSNQTVHEQSGYPMLDEFT